MEGAGLGCRGGHRVEVVIDPDTVERFIASSVDPGRSRPTYRSELRRLGRCSRVMRRGRLGLVRLLVFK